MSKVFGISSIYLNGQEQRSKDGASIMIGGVENTAQKGKVIHGFSESLVPAEVEFTMSMMADTDLIALRIFEGTVKFETDVGVSWLVTGAKNKTPPKVTGGDGDIEVSMVGNPAVQE